jgi:predicted RNA binding protein YcfA (HicA-like mRNA interferase family)
VTKVPSLNYPAVINALKRAGWVVVRQRGSHVAFIAKHPTE